MVGLAQPEYACLPYWGALGQRGERREGDGREREREREREGKGEKDGERMSRKERERERERRENLATSTVQHRHLPGKIWSILFEFPKQKLKTQVPRLARLCLRGVHPMSILHLEKAQDERYFGRSQKFREKHEFDSEKAAFAAHLEMTKIADL